MGVGGRKLVATDEPAIVSESFLDATMVEDSEGNGGFLNPPWTDEGNWGKAFCETDDLLDQFIASETDLGSWGGDSPRGMLCEGKTVDPMLFEVADLV